MRLITAATTYNPETDSEGHNQFTIYFSREKRNTAEFTKRKAAANLASKTSYSNYGYGMATFPGEDLGMISAIASFQLHLEEAERIKHFIRQFNKNLGGNVAASIDELLWQEIQDSDEFDDVKKPNMIIYTPLGTFNQYQEGYEVNSGGDLEPNLEEGTILHGGAVYSKMYPVDIKEFKQKYSNSRIVPIPSIN